MLTDSVTQDFRWGAEVMADRHVQNPDAALSGAAKAHYPALQSARGLAAIAVLTCHSLLVFETSGGIHALARITEPLAHVAVVFFFVLSGSSLRSPSPPKRLLPGLLGNSIFADSLEFFLHFWLLSPVRVFFFLWVAGMLPLAGGPGIFIRR